MLLLANLAIAQPVVNLGPDLGACDSITLDAGNPGASFLWNTNETSQTITVSSSGIYWVDVTDGSGTTRDSISVSIVPTPSLPTTSDTSVCGPGIYTFSTGVSTDQALWYDAPTGGNLISLGNPTQIPVDSTSTYYVEVANFAISDTIGLSDLTNFTLGYQSGGRGLTFDVFSPAVLQTVTVYASEATTFRIQLEDNGGGILDSITVTVPGGEVPVAVPLYFDLPVGTGFILRGVNINTSGSGLGFLNAQLPYPYQAPGLVSITSADNGNTNRYYYFYNWVVSSQGCKSSRKSFTATLLPSPEVDLGNDSIICGSSYTLDVTNPGASYLWNTGATMPSIVITQGDTISVAATIGSCTISDTVIIDLLPDPSSPSLNDTSVCGPGTYSIIAGGVHDLVLWFDSDTSEAILDLGDSISVTLTDTDTLYAEAINLTPSDTAGLSDLTGFTLGFQANDRGMVFDVMSPSVLQSVAVYANQPGIINIRLENSAGTILTSKTVDIPIGGGTKNIVPLYFDLPVGTGFKLMGTKVSGLGSGLGFLNAQLPYPYIAPGLVSINSADNGSTNRYYYFYEWVVTQKVCRSPRIPIQITVLPAPSVELGADTVVCGNTFVLDATSPGATYIWNTTETTPSISISNTGLYSVDASLGACTISDSIFVEFTDVPDVPIVADLDVCGAGEYLLTASSTSSYDLIRWYEDASISSSFAEGDSVMVPISDSSTLYAEAINFAGLDTTGIIDLSGFTLGFQDNDRGMEFDVFQPAILKSVIVYADQAGFANIRLETSGGTILDSTTVFIPNGNGDRNYIPLYFDLPVGTGLRLMGTKVSGLGVGLGFLNVPIPYPYEIPEILSITSANGGSTNRYYYFFEWEVTRKICQSPREAFQVNVLPSPIIDLGPDTAICGTDYPLTAFNPGASYLWSTGETSADILVTTTDTFFVDATIGSCTKRDSIAVELVPPPLNLVPNDTNICNTGVHPYTFDHPGDLLLWYEDKTTEQILAAGDTLFYPTQDTTTLYAESVAFSEIFFAGRSLPNPVLAGYQSNVRGAEFTVSTPLVLTSVKMYADAPTDLTIILETQQGVELDSLEVHIPDMLGTEVLLFFDLVPGSYRLIGKDVVGGNLAFFGSGSSYPYAAPGFLSVDASNTGSTSGYYYFYDWKVSRQACFSSRDSVTVEIAIPLNLGADLYSCDEVVLDAGNPALNIAWSTGETTPQITVTETGKYWVDLSDGQGCVSTDTIEITIPALDLGEDGTICGTSLITGYDSTSTFLWNTGDTIPNLALADTGLFWVTIQEPLGCTLTDTIFVTGFADFPDVDLGADFSACDSATIDAGNPGLSYLWSTGDTTQSIQVYSAGIYGVAVTNQFGCTTEGEVNVFVAPSPTAEFAFQASGGTIIFENLSSLGSNFWNFGDGNTSNLLSPVHTYTDTGTYTVRLVVVDILNNCGSDTFFLDITISSLTSIDGNFLGGSIDVFPNPVSQQFTIHFQSIPSGDVQILLIDPAGREILRKERTIFSPDQKERVSVPNSATSGIYYLIVRKGPSQYAEKIMIQ